ncbi:MAG: hypothetical protein IT434_14490 [Phycisphaerales bacterium]|jgi:hypothetical protein|nr:hypothetical protein [Phycisphaerales bacterium]
MDRHAARFALELPSPQRLENAAEVADSVRDDLFDPSLDLAFDPENEQIAATPGDPADLRRKRRRAFADRMLERAIHLQAPDRTLIEASFRDSLRVVELAALIHSRAPTDTQVRAMRRRIRALVRRLLHPRFDFVVRALANAEGIPRAPWSPLRARVAREFFLQGRTMRAIAADTRQSFYLVRRHRDAVEALFDMHAKRSHAHA